jgi:peptidoglycan hydrolase-like protein with peptidoglycan-binding domain
MERTLFAKGIRGEVVKRVQIKLKERGFDPGGIDGVF